MSYSFESRVRFSEIGEDGCLTLPGVLDYFQDCCTFESEQTGVGMEVLKEQKRAWVLSAWQVIVKRYPKLGENIKVTTIPYGFRGFIGMRNFILETMDGEKLAWANSYWSFINTETGLPEKLTPADTDPYDLGEKIEMDYAPRIIMLTTVSISGWQRIICLRILKSVSFVLNINVRQYWIMLSFRKYI